jgi:very-short-patch-repair endonuclease
LWVPAPPEIEVVVDIWDGAASPGVSVHRSRILERRDVWIREGLPVTSPARTLLDIAVSATDRQLEVAFDRGIAERTLRLSYVRDVLDRAGGHRGRARLAALLEQEHGASTMTRSEGEERMLALMRQSGLPIPHVNAKFGIWELDFYWPEARFVVELDTHTYHSSRYRFERDRRKDNDLRRADIEVMRIVRRELKERTYGIVSDVARALTRRGI